VARIRPLGICEECPAGEGEKEIVSHNLCAKHNQRRLRAIWRKPEQSETQKQKLMEKLEKDLIAVKNMCSRWERDGYVAMDLITAETIETFRTELDDYLDFRPTLKSIKRSRRVLHRPRWQAVSPVRGRKTCFVDKGRCKDTEECVAKAIQLEEPRLNTNDGWVWPDGTPVNAKKSLGYPTLPHDHLQFRARVSR
jgi:hypothetical protein